MGQSSGKIRGKQVRRSRGLARRSRPFAEALEGRALLATGISFAEPTAIPPLVTSNGQTLGVAKGDFNGDGKLDLAVTYTSYYGNGDHPGQVAIVAGNGDGTFRAATDLPVPAPAIAGTFTKLYGILARDFNKDGKLDLMVAEPDQQALLYYQGHGDGTFSPATVIPTGARVDSIQTADLNGDGSLDLVGLDQADNSVSVLLGRGDGTFSAPTVYANVGSGVADLALGDVDARNGSDIVLASPNDGNLNVLLNDGTGHFGPVVSTPLKTPYGYFHPLTVTAADFLGNGTTQVVIGSSDSPYGIFLNSYTGPSTVLLRPVGDGTFALPADGSGYTPEDEYPARYYSENVAPDLNGDGKPDLLLGHSQGQNLVTVGLNRGDGTFAVSHYVAAPGPGPDVLPNQYNNKETQNPGVVLAGDFHGTGIPDIVTGSFYDHDRPGGLALLTAVPSAPGTYLSPRTSTTLALNNSGNRMGHDQLLGPFGPNGAQALVTLDGSVDYINTAATFLSLLNPDGTFAPPTVASAFNGGGGTSQSQLASADFNGDGRPDLVSLVPDAAGSTVSFIVSLNNGDGTYTPHGYYLYDQNGQRSLSPGNLAIGDFNGDGRPDLAIEAGTEVDVFLNDGQGGLALTARLPQGSGVPNTGLGVAAGDFNGDGKGDIVTGDGLGDFRSDDMLLFKGNGDGTFQAPVVIGSPIQRSSELKGVDLRHNGRLDLVGLGATDIEVYLNNGDGTFQAPTSYPIGSLGIASDFQVGDLNGDGNPDIAAAGSGLFVLAGNGDGTFDPASQFAIGSPLTQSVNIGDVNGDGKPDVVISRGERAGDATTVAINATPLTVKGVTTTSTGFTASFSAPFNLAQLNLYGTAAANLGPADVSLVGANTGPVRGSLIVSPDNKTITFVKTGGVLVPDTYTLTLRSAANGFRDLSGGSLDGNGDGTPGDNETTTFTVAPSSARIVAIPDFARGPGQAVNVPAATGNGLPLTISDGTGVTSISLTLTYNPALLTITGAILGASAPAGSSVTVNTATPGQAVLTFTSPTALPSGLDTFAALVASVPTSAPYASKEALVIGNLAVNGSAIAATDDDGVHVVGYLGDTTGNGGYSGLDAALISRVVANIDSGFAAFPLLDPTVLADVAGRNSLTALDAAYVSQFVANIPQPRIPALPGVTITRGGPDPLVWLPQNLSGATGSSFTLPVMFRQTNGSAIGLNAADVAIEFDPSVFTVTGVRLGNLPQGFTLTEAFDNATGEIVASLRSSSGSLVLPPGYEGSLLLVDLAIRPGASPGSSRINLLGEGRVGSNVLYTSLNGGNLSLVPAPTDNDLDPTDGVVNVTNPTTSRVNLPTDPGTTAPNQVVATITTAAAPLPSALARATVAVNPSPISSSLARAIVSGGKPVPAGPRSAVVRALEPPHGNRNLAHPPSPLADPSVSVSEWIPWTSSDPSGVFLGGNDAPGATVPRKARAGRGVVNSVNPV